MENTLKSVVPDTPNVSVPVPQVVEQVVNVDPNNLVSKSFLSKLYDKKLYVLLLLVAIGGVVFYYKKKNALKGKLKDFKDLHQDFKPATELNKDLQMKDLELTTLKQQNEHLFNENNRLQQQQVLLEKQQKMLLQKQQMHQQQMQQNQMGELNNNDRIENDEVEYNNLGEDDNVQQYNLTSNEMNDVVQALEQ